MSSTFSSLGLSDPQVSALAKLGITEPFPVQEAAIPSGLSGRDIQCKAPTGSGKTLAFGLPMLSNVPRAKPKRPGGLVLAPTRELAEQIRRDLAPLADATHRQVAAVYGGVSYGDQKRALRHGVDILVATPGRLEDLMSQGCVDLGDVEMVTIDEADRMADMGFLPAVRRILKETRRHRQTLLFSATLDGEVAVLARESQHDPVKVVSEATSADEIKTDHHFWRVDRGNRLDYAASVINGSDRTIVFTRTRHGADRLVKQLGRADIAAVAMHGGRSQSQRTRALRSFTNGRARALVATDVAARGIHVDDIDVVLHYDLANDHKDYLHRSGRTARAGAAGTVITLVVAGQEKDVKKIQRAAGMTAPIEMPDGPTRASSLDRKPASKAPRVDRDSRGRPGTADGRGRPGTAAGSGNLNIFVGNLPWRVDETDLVSLFARHGRVDGARIARRSGRSKGYGFVEMPADQGQKAIRALDSSDLGGRSIRVREAR
jgi:superfamily II DNA/RNA helicase